MQGDAEDISLEEGKDYLNRFIAQIKNFLESKVLEKSNDPFIKCYT